jgi:hypothetical protein
MISLEEIAGNKTSAGLVLVDHEGRVGLVYNRKKRKVALPYGGIENKQTPIQTAHIEARQEMGVWLAKTNSLLGIYKIQESTGAINVRFMYQAQPIIYAPWLRNIAEIEETYFLKPQQIRQIPRQDICRPTFMYKVLEDLEAKKSFPILRRINQKSLTKYPSKAFTYLPNLSEDHSDEN